MELTMTLGDKLDAAFYNFDMWIFSIFGALQNPVTLFIAKIFTALGDEAFVIPVAVFGLCLCFFKRTRKYGAALVAAIAIGTIVTNLALKPLVLRVRPYNTLQHVAEYFGWYKAAGMLSESDYSFPSGHTTGAFEIAVASGLWLRSRGRKGLSWIPPVLACGVMCSRIMLMVHYPTDVIGGCIAGSLAGVIGYFLAAFLVKHFDKTKLGQKIDLEQTIFKKELSGKTAGLICIGVLFVFFLISFIPSLSEGGDDVIRCAYAGEDYTCYNEAKVDDDDYPAIDGKNYCKIHWKQLNGETEETTEAEAVTETGTTADAA